MRLIFNSLSLRNLNNVEPVINSIDNLFKIKKQLKSDVDFDVLFHSNISSISLENGRNFIDFLQLFETPSNSEYIAYLRDKIFNVPYIDQIEDNIEYDVSYESEIVSEFKIVYKFKDCILKSFFTHEKWENFLIQCKQQSLDENTSEINISDVNIKNIGKLEKIDEDCWIYEYLQNEDENNLDSLLANLSSYNNLLFSKDVITSIRSYGENTSLINALVRNFEIMQLYCEKFWHFGNLRISHLKDLGLTTIKPESDVTLSKFGSQRLFIDHNGVRSTEPYSFHFNLPDFKRCYIKGIEEDGKRKILVAYIGEHLSTVDSP
ncbi:hypothetical protein VXQ12_08855 [Acinetobacter baumannii]|uniref:hypothetical protein n=2 Tax=Acinetobacter TaxID=469 RepID=UPI0019112945|nr:hypothetical protein [Acinetobacter baumannii]EHU2502374.1 hypothetical protein [Acinetobacter baumannii]MBK5980593.1 hypothetical protein [Acinetobacter baumannii]MDX6036803.1 hypothetical protein [Acinetobacter baumannii]